MPTLKIKTIYIERLKAFGVYDQWLANIKALNPNDSKIEYIQKSDSFSTLINRSFSWQDTTEGADFWLEIYNERCPH